MSNTALLSTLQSMNRKYGAATINTPDKLKALALDRIPTGVKVLDDALGGGFPKGSMAELFGYPSSGKTLISLLTIKQAQAMGLDCIFFDLENSYDEKWVSSLGVDPKKIIISQMDTGEDLIDSMCNLLDANPGVIVIDSVAAIITKNELESEAEQRFIAPLARLLSYGLKRVNHHNRNTVILFINQIRQKITNIGSIPYTPGGSQLGHLASIRLKVAKDPLLITESGKKLDKNVIAQIVNFETVKNKTNKPHVYGSFRYFYDGRIEE